MSSVTSDPDALASLYRYMAESEFRGYCPIYERIALALANDHELLTRIAAAADGAKLVPVLLNAAVHDLVLGEPDQELAQIYASGDGDPWPAYRRLVVERFDELVAVMRRRSIQTNEVGRAAVLLPALGRIHAQFARPLELIEIGCSAGLNLYLDRFHYAYSDGRSWGDPHSPVQLGCEVLGPTPPPVPHPSLPIARREGIDLDPVDVTDPADRRWLQACLWPQLPERAERLAAAIALAESDPPRIHRGDALDLIAEVIRAGDPDNVTVVFATWVLAYFPTDARVRLASILEDLGRERPLALVTGEYPGVASWVPAPARPCAAGETKGASVLGALSNADGSWTAEVLAWMHAHGQWIDWLAPYPGT
jgi:hypothetical protein